MIETILLTLVIVAGVVWIFIRIRPNSNLSGFRAKDLDTIFYNKKSLLSDNERIFMEKMEPLGEHGLIVLPQINLASIINKISDSHYRTELFRNIDFGIFDNNYNPLLLIELNDTTHQQNYRKYRDYKVRDIAGKAGISFMTFYTDKPNEQSYVLNRIVDKLKEQGNV